ncbi:zinc finger protein 12-like isoform X3 [Portunus trituberculatus]|uniref:zinc finger protein 12-like isoform X3 n=1 Tax=Portunus trituberculatus TaxID=210409 RepID=UPI001E1CFDE8|nr:zinc finger protein 12-like isoform X3 [Portunus trituberculatus]
MVTSLASSCNSFSSRSDLCMEEYETRCSKKFELDNTIYEKLISVLQSGYFINGETKPERRFIRRKASNFQWDASRKILYYIGSDDGKRRQVVRTREALADVLQFHHSSATSRHNGVKTTYSRVAKLYYWRSMIEDVKHYVESCSECRHLSSVKTQAPTPTMQPIKVNKVSEPGEPDMIDQDRVEDGALLGTTSHISGSLSSHSMSDLCVEEYETRCSKKFELDNTIYEKLISVLQSGYFINGETKPERRFIRRKASNFQWDASRKILYYIGSADGKRRQVVRTREALADVLQFHHSSATSRHNGVKTTYSRVAKLYYWRSMLEDVKHYVESCSECRHLSSVKTQAPTPPMQPIKVNKVSELGEPDMIVSSIMAPFLPCSTDQDRVEDGALLGTTSHISGSLSSHSMSDLCVEEYETRCSKKFELDNTIYEKLISVLQSGNFVNGETKPERKFIRRKASNFQWDASRKILYYIGSSDGKRRQVVESCSECRHLSSVKTQAPTPTMQPIKVNKVSEPGEPDMIDQAKVQDSALLGTTSPTGFPQVSCRTGGGVCCREQCCSGGMRTSSSMSEQQQQKQQQPASGAGRASRTGKNDMEEGSSGRRRERKFWCQLCDKTFKSKQSLRVHTLCHSSVRNYECPEYGKKFSQKCHLTAHTLTHSGVKNYECEECGERFITSFNLNRHALSHSGLREFQEQCCAGEVRPGSSMSEQQQQQSTTSVGKSSSGETDLEAGSSSHRKERKFECQQCDKTFRSKQGLKLHTLRRSGVRNFECPKCGKKFSQKGHLNIHILTHSDVRNYKCLVCGKKFTTKSDLTMHTLTHSGVRNYECEKCGKKFTRKSHLIRHTLTHSGVRNYECLVCGRKFIQKSSLTTHTLTHSGVKNYECLEWGKKFAEKRSLTTHSDTQWC